MKRIAWGGGFVLVFCVLCMMLTGDAADEAATVGKNGAPAEAGVPVDDADATEAPAFVSANWNTEEVAPAAAADRSLLPDEEPPAWAKRLKGTGVVHFDGKNKREGK